MKNSTLLRIALIATCLLASGAGAASAGPAPLLLRQGERLVIPADSPLRKRIAVSPVGTQTVAHGLQAPAVVEADPARVIAVVPPLTGRLVELKVALGDTVRRGQVLAVISSPDFGQARDDATKAADALALADRALARARAVLTAGANAGKDLEAAESAQRQAAAEDLRTRDRLSTLAPGAPQDRRARDLDVIAPISGTVTALNVGSGAYLNDATATLMTVAALDRVWVTAQVPEQSLAGIAAGQAVDIALAAWPGQVLHARVSRVSPLLEPDTHRVKVRIAVDNADGRLKPNMFANVSFAVPQSAAAGVSVPASALLMNNDRTTVFIEVAPWVFVPRVVELGAEDNETVRIVHGLQAGERVVTRGGILLND